MRNMHHLLIKKIIELWDTGCTDGFQECCHRMKWLCQTDFCYPTDRFFGQGHEQMFAVEGINGDTIYVIQFGESNEDLKIVLYSLGDEELLYLFQCMVVEKFK